MMISEFIERTGFEPTASEYAKIEKAYYDFNGNKDEFCKAFVKNGGEKKIVPRNRRSTRFSRNCLNSRAS